ncbi:caspase-3-like [Diadema antillarum]|uniref:caspase-3-like n=1 Tax=Diadema antillarum TaxID=105358 RepID=UPI003A850C47
MDQNDRKTIRKNLPKLANDIDFDMVSMGLQARLIFEPHHIEKFQSKPSKMTKNQTMLMDLETRGPKAFNALIESLVEAEQVYLAELLGYSGPAGVDAQTMQPGQSGVAQASTPHDVKPQPFGQPTAAQRQAPAQWPNPSAPSDLSDVEMDISSVYPQSMTDNDNVYKMSSRPRGIAIIINNKKFKTMKTRQGTDVDGRNLENVFKQLGFNTVVHRDLKGRDIQQLMIQLSRHNHTTFDCFILAILTHGIEGAVYGTDEQLVKIEDLVNYFSSDRCPTLAGKPKLFFLQACRGERFDAGVEQTDGTAVAGSGDGARLDSISMTEDELVDKMLRMELESTDSFASARSKMPTQSDILLAYATVPGYVSWRNSEKGSWFIQALTEVMLQNASQEDMLSMMTMVNGKVARAFESSSGRHKQMPAPVTMLTKKLYFFPGFHN